MNKHTHHPKHAGHTQPTGTPVWFITGCSTGFGQELARQAIERGYRTVVTARDTAKLQGGVASDHVRAAEERFGGIDVLANNASIGYFAAIEEGDATEVRKMYAVEVSEAEALTRTAVATRSKSAGPPSS